MWLSVIIPVYKTEHYLDACVRSVLSQQGPAFEVITVDDGSPDRCPELCDAWAEKDARVKVIHKPNGGLSSARNAGLAAARGDYILFLDSDDTHVSGSFAALQAQMQAQPVEILNFGINIIRNNRVTEVWGMPAFHCEGPTQLKQYLPAFIEKLMGCSVNKLYARSFFDRTGLKFDEMVQLSEDANFTLLAYSKAISTANVPDAYYNYWHHDNLSITRAGRVDLVEVWQQRSDLLAQLFQAVGCGEKERAQWTRDSKANAVYNQYVQAISSVTHLPTASRREVLRRLFSDAEYYQLLREKILKEERSAGRRILRLLTDLRAAGLLAQCAAVNKHIQNVRRIAASKK